MTARPVLASIASTMWSSWPAVVFAVLPLFGAFVATAAFDPPDLGTMLRPAAVVAGTVIACNIALAGLGIPPRVGTTAVTAAAMVFGLYPFIGRLWPGQLRWPLAVFHLALCVATLATTLRSPWGRSRAFHNGLRIMAGVLSITMVVTIVQAHVRDLHAAAPRLEIPLIETRTTARPPDIYHIVVDGFGRPDVLRDKYGLDLSSFTTSLEKRGFEVSQDAVANYVLTAQSLASMLNLTYLDAVTPEPLSYRILSAMFFDNMVAKSLRALNYDVLVASAMYPPARIMKHATWCECTTPLIGGYESIALKFTPLEALGFWGIDHLGYRNKIRRTLATLDSLEPPLKPRFLFAHVLAPHPPFVFDAVGRPVVPKGTLTQNDGSWLGGTPDEYKHGYRNQADYIASRVLSSIDHLLGVSNRTGHDAVIVVHGDHGPRLSFDGDDSSRTDSTESVPVLLAIRWPTGQGAAPRRVRSLVNVYREVFHRYFGADLVHLPDRSFLSSFRHPFRFVEVPTK